MNELKTTILFLGGAAVLTAAALVIDPGSQSADVFDDQGELFYPEFTDPQAPKSIEVIDYDDETATATPLKVEFRDNKWLLPSHNDYPADAENRLADTAAALIELKKDAVVSERTEDHAEYGVIDPFDEGAVSLEGRGKRVTLKDGDDQVLADFVIGDEVEGQPGSRYLRVPGQRKTYAVKTDVDPSAEFQDWIETDLLKLKKDDIRRIAINHYRVDERMRRLMPGEQFTLSKDGDDWKVSGSGRLDDDKLGQLTSAIESLRIVDVQPKPDILTADLKTTGQIQPTYQAAVLLQEKGFYLGGAGGQIFGNEGEIVVDGASGVRYTLRFGEIASSSPAQKEEGENRYLLIAVSHSEAREKEYGGSDGKDLYDELNNRFADWYYVISGGEFSELMRTRRSLLR